MPSNVQIVLIGLVYLLMPRSEHIETLPNPDEMDTLSSQAENMSNKIPEGKGHDAYVIIFDAGSTGEFRKTLFTAKSIQYSGFFMLFNLQPPT